VKVQLKGDRELIEEFEGLREFVRGNPFSQACRAAARLMMDEIVARAPVATGKLVSNLRVAVRRAQGRVSARVLVNTAGKAGDSLNAFYWRFVEFGHRTRGGKGYVQPQPFVTPAFESTKNESAQLVIDTFGAAIDRAAARQRRAAGA
jgi:HK97 gp10 family phage protein